MQLCNEFVYYIFFFLRPLFRTFPFSKDFFFLNVPYVTPREYFKQQFASFLFLFIKVVCAERAGHIFDGLLLLCFASLLWLYGIAVALTFSTVGIPFRNDLDVGGIWAVLHVKSSLG